MTGLGADIRGRWTARQLAALVPLLDVPEGVRLAIVEITTQSDPVRWYHLHLICSRHETPIPYGDVCYKCVSGEPVDPPTCPNDRDDLCAMFERAGCPYSTQTSRLNGAPSGSSLVILEQRPSRLNDRVLYVILSFGPDGSFREWQVSE